ncbi:MAG: hypothetical protein V4664_02805 [Patescibacteria group bacterium]
MKGILTSLEKADALLKQVEQTIIQLDSDEKESEEVKARLSETVERLHTSRAIVQRKAEEIFVFLMRSVCDIQVEYIIPGFSVCKLLPQGRGGVQIGNGGEQQSHFYWHFFELYNKHFWELCRAMLDVLEVFLQTAPSKLRDGASQVSEIRTRIASLAEKYKTKE